MRLAIGTRPAADLPVEFVEASTYDEVRPAGRRHEIDLLVLDGEAAPAGGLGIARQLKDEIDDCPPTCVVIARAADRWLAAYAEVDATLIHPLDPMTTGQTVAAHAARPRRRRRPLGTARRRPAVRPPASVPRRPAMGERTWPNLLVALLRGEELSTADTAWAMGEIMAGEATPAQIAGFAVALRAKGETPGEIAGLVEAMLGAAARVDLGAVLGAAAPRRGRRGRHRRRPGAHREHLHDGGASWWPAPGVRVVKHGNRAASSLVRHRRPAGAPRHPARPRPGRGGPVRRRGRHRLLLRRRGSTRALRHAGRCRGARWACRPSFNFLGPLTNPAQPRAGAIGCADPRMAADHGGGLRPPRRLGARDARRGRARRVHHHRADPGLGGRRRHGRASRSSTRPTSACPRPQPDDLRGGDAAVNADVARRVLRRRDRPVRDAVLVNAAAALVAYDGAGHGWTSPALCAPGLERAAAAVDSGAAAEDPGPLGRNRPIPATA